MRDAISFWGWGLATVLVGIYVPATVMLRSSAVPALPLQVTVACLLPILVGMTFRSAASTINRRAR